MAYGLRVVDELEGVLPLVDAGGASGERHMDCYTLVQKLAACVSPKSLRACPHVSTSEAHTTITKWKVTTVGLPQPGCRR